MHVTIGYITSRPALKVYARKMNSLLQICKQVEMMGEVSKLLGTAVASSQRLRELTNAVWINCYFYTHTHTLSLSSFSPALSPIFPHLVMCFSQTHLLSEEALAVVQHHDAISYVIFRTLILCPKCL